ncbi:hypothetical protein LTR37_011377 [Vermiconidia calcicola]|uniref:Uncharacterized protein n=1 Tax=Vermiconidia calcicola TaxID=1690605 RepID=A0ACC3N3Z1_9PEZI|nr:hypothetical protein LTR37_011377 [Vermiconidia calcicola]
MPAITKRQLKGWVVYLIVIFLPDGTNIKYVGRSTTMDGSRICVLDRYQKAIRKGRDRFLTCLVISNEWTARAVGPGARVHLRPLINMDIPETEEGRKEGERWM